MQIGIKDIFWNYAATFLKIASSALLIPFILKMMPSETVGIWSIFMTITSFTILLDFGFNPSFTRNVTYIFSGVRSLRTTGFESVPENQTVDYGLLKGVISAMRWYYIRMAAILLLLLITLGTYYIYRLLEHYENSHSEVYTAWVILCVINTYNLFTLYYDSLLQGKGLIKRSKQILIMGQTAYLVIAAILILSGYGLVAIVSAQASSVIIVRWFARRAFFTNDIKQSLSTAQSHSREELLKVIYPNSVKIGLTSVGSFLIQRSAILIGSLYLALEQIASYAITMQLIAVIAGLASIYSATYLSKIVQLRVSQDLRMIKDIYLRSQLILLLTFIGGGMGLIFLGSWTLDLIGSKTQLMSVGPLLLALFLVFEQTNLSIAGNILLTKNEVPFFKSALISGACIVIGLFIAFQFFDWGVLTMLIIPLIIDIAYQAWKWPFEVKKDLGINLTDIFIRTRLNGRN